MKKNVSVFAAQLRGAHGILTIPMAASVCWHLHAMRSKSATLTIAFMGKENVLKYQVTDMIVLSYTHIPIYCRDLQNEIWYNINNRFLSFQEPRPPKIVFITGGYQLTEHVSQRLDQSEIIDIPDGSYTCIDPAPLDYSTYQGATLRTSRGHPLVCGGAGMGSACVEFDPISNAWLDGPSMREIRQGPAYTELSDGSSWILKVFWMMMPTIRLQNCTIMN